MSGAVSLPRVSRDPSARLWAQVLLWPPDAPCPAGLREEGPAGFRRWLGRGVRGMESRVPHPPGLAPPPAFKSQNTAEWFALSIPWTNAVFPELRSFVPRPCSRHQR